MQRPAEARDGLGWPRLAGVEPAAAADAAPARPDRVEPEAEAGRQQLRLPALLHLLDHHGAAPRPLHINARLRLRAARRRPLQEDRHGESNSLSWSLSLSILLVEPVFQVE